LGANGFNLFGLHVFWQIKIVF